MRGRALATGTAWAGLCLITSLVSVRLLLGLVGYDGEWRHVTPPPGGLKGVEGGKKKKKRRLGRRDSRAGRLTGARTPLITGKEGL